MSAIDVRAQLAIPGVKLLVVEFFASWCGPCMEAVPRWEALREKYGKRGLRLVVVAVREDETSCRNIPWTPDQIICDQDGEIARRFGVERLPAAFLWTWQGELLGTRLHSEDVESRIDGWMKAIPRVAVEVAELPANAGIQGAQLRRLVASELAASDKLTVVASADERSRLRALAKESLRLGRDGALSCDIGREVSANNLLEITITPGRMKQLRRNRSRPPFFGPGGDRRVGSIVIYPGCGGGAPSRVEVRPRGCACGA